MPLVCGLLVLVRKRSPGIPALSPLLEHKRTYRGHCEIAANAESTRGISPRAAHRSGLDTLASSGSCHRAKAAAFRRELELLLLPVGSRPTSMTCPLRSTSITPASSLQ